MRIVVVGAGAIGGVIGGRLARAGADVVLVARGAHLEAIRERGLRVEGPDETFVVHPPTVADWRTDSIAVLATKTQDAERALEGVPRELPVACATNGVEAERIAARLGHPVIGMCVYLPATHLAPGVVQAWSAPLVGVLDLGDNEELATALRLAGFASEVKADIMRWKRGKLLSNLGNAIEALCGPAAKRGELDRRARAEGIACYQSAGLTWPTPEEEAARRAGIVSRPIAGATRGGGSTWQSLVRGKRLECDYLNGEIVRLGAAHGVATPINAALLRLANEATAAGAMSIEELTARVTERS
jgi:2-dehydropantoate 2-reductase